MENPASTTPAISGNDRLWGALAHLSALLGYATVVGWFVGPLVVWLLKRDTSAYVAEQAREALNFAISIIIYSVICFVLCLTLIWLFFAPFAFGILAAFHIICIIIAGIKAYEGRGFRYPFTIRLIS